MEHGLFAVELRDRRQNSSGITGEQDDISRMFVRDARYPCIVDVFDGVSTAKCEHVS